MKLLAVYEYLKEHGLSNINDISKAISEPVEVTRELLSYWIDNGKAVKFLSDQSCCSTGKGCGSCTLLSLEMYDVSKMINSI